MPNISAKTCGGKISDSKCQNTGWKPPSWYDGNFQAGLPNLNTLGYEECVRLGWERLPDGSFKLRVRFQRDCVDRLMADPNRLKYNDSFHKGQCPGEESPEVGQIYTCIDRFGTALIKTPINDVYDIDFRKECQGPYQNIWEEIPLCVDNLYSGNESLWGEITTAWSEPVEQCITVSPSLCGNYWEEDDTYVLAGALPNDTNVIPQGTCTGLEPPIVSISKEDPSLCGGFIPCGRITTYRCVAECYIIDENEDIISTADGDSLVWCFRNTFGSSTIDVDPIEIG
jgi:hypothetical protein